MAKGGNNQRSNCSRFTKPYDASNSFVKKVALRVSGYLGGLFGSSVKSDDSISGDRGPFTGTDDATITHSHYETTDSGKQMGMMKCYDDIGVNNSPGKSLSVGIKRKFVPDLAVSPIASTSSLFQSSVNHDYDIQHSEDFIASVAGPSGLQKKKYAQANSISTSTSTNTNIKANGATDNHSDSSESTSGCSSLVPQSDRLSQSAFVSNSRKKILEEKLQYARQLKQNRTSAYFNRSIPVVSDTTGSRRKPSFDVSVYGSPIFDKSSVREKMVNSPFYTGQTSYGGASAYRRTRAALCSQTNNRSIFDRKEGLQIQVKPSHHGSSEDLSNMSHTAKRILEALEQFSTPISDAKRIPVNAVSPPLGRKRNRYGDAVDAITSLSTIKSNANPPKGPVISGLNIPTVPDLLKLKRLEKIQDSTAAAREVAVQKQEYSLPTDAEPSKHTGKIVTKRKDKEKEVNFERPPEVNLPKVSLPISTLPKFDFKLPPITKPISDDSSKSKCLQRSEVGLDSKLSDPNKLFVFSEPITLKAPKNAKNSYQKSNFTFSTPLKANKINDKTETTVLTNVSNFMSAEALSKLKRKPISDKPKSALSSEPAKELKELKELKQLNQLKQLKELKERKELKELKEFKEIKEIKELKELKEKASSPISDSKTVNFASGFGNKFKPPSDSWSCKECFVNNNASATKCIACENPKPMPKPVAENVAKPPAPEVKTTGFGDLFKKKAGQWECSVCLIQNKEIDLKCAACESPKPGAKIEKPEPPKFTFGIPPEAASFKFGIDKADVKPDGKNDSKPAEEPPVQAAVPAAAPTVTTTASEPPKPLHAVATPFGVFTFGIPPTGSVTSSTESKDTGSKPPEEVAMKESSDAGAKSKITPPNNTFMSKPISFENKQAPTTFSFGATAERPPAERPINTSPFGSSLKTTETVPSSNTSSIFGQSDPVKPTVGDNDLNKPPQFPKFTFSAKSDQQPPPASNNVEKPENVSEGAKSPVSSTTTTNCNLTVTTSSVFGSSDSIVKEKPSAPCGFGESGSNPVSTTPAPASSITPNFFSSEKEKEESKPFKFFGGFETTNNAFMFGNPNPPTKYLFGNYEQPKPAPVFGSSMFGKPPEAGAFGWKNGGNDCGKAPEFPKFSFTGKTNEPGLASNITNADNSKSTENVLETGKTENVTLTTNSVFGSPEDAGRSVGAEKPPMPFIFGESNNKNNNNDNINNNNNNNSGINNNNNNNNNNSFASTNTPAMPTTAPGIFTFRASKPEMKPVQFSGGFGQNNRTFTFGSPNPNPNPPPNPNPNPPPNNLFGNFNQSETASPFGNANSSFGNLFGWNSASPAFGGTQQPKFEFGSSSQQPAPQLFQFEAANPQTQVTSTPATTFSTSVPQKFNFTGGKPATFSAAPNSAPPEPPRRKAKAFRRTHR